MVEHMISTMWFKLNEWHYLILKRDIYLFVLSPVKLFSFRFVCIVKIVSIILHFFFNHEVFNYIWWITRGCFRDHVSFYMIWEEGWNDDSVIIWFLLYARYSSSNFSSLRWALNAGNEISIVANILSNLFCFVEFVIC